MEALWRALKLIPIGRLHRVKLGIKAIKSTYHLLEPPPEAYVEAMKICHEGHRDYIDALHYATAKVTNIPWLTVDETFIEFLRKHGYPIKGIVVTPKEFKELVYKHARS